MERRSPDRNRWRESPSATYLERAPLSLRLLAAAAMSGLMVFISVLMRKYIQQVVFILIWPAVLCSAFLGFGPAVAAIAVGVMGINLEVIPPYNALTFGPLEVMQSALFTVVSLLISRMWAWRRLSEAHLREANERLEQHVRERTEQLEKANEALKRQTAELGRSNTDLEQFAYVASHDLQEPLRMMSSYSELLSRRYKGRLDEDADEFIKQIVMAARRMRALITDLLTYSRVGQTQTGQTSVDLRGTIQSVLATLAQFLKDAGATVEVRDVPAVKATFTEMQQVMQNLITNAVKYRGAQPPHIIISGTEQNGVATITVEDNGAGIDPAYHDRIFGMFQRLYSWSQIEGSGVGLAVCKKIVERHGGKIWVKSRPGAGSTFYFTLPVGKAHEVALA